MPSTDISGQPILILVLLDVIILESLLDKPATPDQDRLKRRITNFLDDPESVKWEQEHGTS